MYHIIYYRQVQTAEDNKLVPFKVNVPDSVLADLKTRLGNARYKEDLEENTFNYGFRVSECFIVNSFEFIDTG